jgi:hypothetical protein
MRRFDVLVYGRNNHAYLVVECKAPEIKLSRWTQYQAAEYNGVLGARYVLITNGLFFEVWERNDSEYRRLDILPIFSDAAENS